MLRIMKNKSDNHFLPFYNIAGRPVEKLSSRARYARQTDPKVTIVQVSRPGQISQVKTLMRSFVEWLYTRYQDCPWFIDGYFNRQNFEAELASLPGAYASPAGRLLLATCQGKAAGCVALRSLDKATCELKRMYVRPEFHGRGIGKKLAAMLVGQARKIGYRRILLDTGRKQIEAYRLYRSLGFCCIEPCYEVPLKQREMLLFMALDL